MIFIFTNKYLKDIFTSRTIQLEGAGRNYEYTTTIIPNTYLYSYQIQDKEQIQGNSLFFLR